jgi:vancomycin resistance protein YoaR
VSDARGEARGLQPDQRRPVLLVGIGAAALVAVFIIGVLVVGTGIARGTTVAGVEIGGQSREEAVATLEEAIGKPAAEPIRLRVADQVFTIEPAKAGLRFDAEATVAQADEATLNPVSMLRSIFADRNLQPVLDVDRQALESALGDISLAVAKPAVEPSLAMDGKQPVLTPGVDGQGLDVEATATALQESFLDPRRAIAGTLTAVPPTVSAEAAKQARDLARAAVSAPIVVSTPESSARLRPKAIARALSFRVQEGQLEPILDGAVLYDSVADKLALVDNPGQDASFTIVDGKPVVVPSKVGRGVSNEDLAAQVLTVLDKPAGEREVSVSIGRREPKLSTEQARELGVTELLSTFTQKFPYAAYRVQNIGQAARYVNGTLLMPGETFSMNDTIKERTEENGYTIGFVVGPGGVFAEEMGGGVSAATTATWTAAFMAGMERVFTQAHSIYISRYQPGLEATVAWGIFDMKFRNDTPNAVFITATTTNTSMTVSFWGTKQYDEVKAEFGERRNVVPFETVYAKSKKNKKCLGQGGVEGFTIDVDRVFIKGGQEVKREKITTLYRPAPEVICDKEKPQEEFGSKPGAKPGNGSQPSTEPTAPADDSGEGAPEFG